MGGASDAALSDCSEDSADAEAHGFGATEVYEQVYDIAVLLYESGHTDFSIEELGHCANLSYAVTSRAMSFWESVGLVVRDPMTNRYAFHVPPD